jgi:flagellar motor switch protein FliN/FliY
MTGDDALLLLGESIADSVADTLRNLPGAGEVDRSPVTLASNGELALQGLPSLGIVTSASYVDGSTGGNVIVMSRRAARRLSALTAGGDPDELGEGNFSRAEVETVGEAAGGLIATAAATSGALLGEELELAEPVTHPYDTPGEALTGIDLAPRATSVTFTLGGESIRLVHLIPNALLIRMTHVFDDREAARTAERFDGAVSIGVRPDTVREVTVSLRAELGRTRLALVQASSLDSGAAVTLDRRVDDPVELFVNGRRFGTGELVSAGGRWAVRITEITGVHAHT